MALLVVGYEGLSTRSSHIHSRAQPEGNMTAEGRQTFIPHYQEGHQLFIIPKVRINKNQQNVILHIKHYG